jgi:succinyl-diaminopimelate desuccinylase
MDPRTEQIVELASRLIEKPSVSPDDAGCQPILRQALESQGFTVESLPFGEVDNFWATHGSGSPIVVFAGHTDVVPTGPVDDWRYPPFEPVVAEGMLHGRGSADMKGSLAAMAVAAGRFLREHPEHPGTLAWLVTSDEEADAVEGTVKVVDWLENRDIRPELCIVGEPSSEHRVGDLIRIGRRGSLNGRLTVKGVQGHVAYPTQAENPIHGALDALLALTSVEWDQGNEAFPPTTLQVSNIHAGTGAVNVIPGELTVDFNLRYSTEQTSQSLETRIDELIGASGLDYRLDWSLSGEPFLTASDSLIDAVSESIQEVCGIEPALSTGGGTSDGRFIARLGTAIVELGPVNATIHSVNECTGIDELGQLSEIYLRILNRLLTTADA